MEKLNHGTIAFCGTVSEFTDKVWKNILSISKCSRENVLLRQTIIEDTLISLTGELKQKIDVADNNSLSVILSRSFYGGCTAGNSILHPEVL